MGVEMYVCLEYKPSKKARYISFHQQQMDKDYAFFSFFNPGFIRENAGKKIHSVPVRGIPDDASFEFLRETLLPVTKKANDMLFTGRKKTILKHNLIERYIHGHRSYKVKVDNEDFITNPDDWGHSFMTSKEWHNVSKTSKTMSKHIQFEVEIIDELMNYFKQHNTTSRVSFFFRG